MNMLSVNESLLLIIDVQERLVNALDKDIVVKKTCKIVEAAKILGVPVVVTEQYPKGLGNTVNSVKEKLPANAKIIEKCSFSAVQEPGFMEQFKLYSRKQVLVCGIETHVCVHQTVADLLTEGYEVYVIKDGCASRNKYEFKQGIDLMEANGAKISCVEIALFEWLKTAKNPKFKEVQALIK